MYDKEHGDDDDDDDVCEDNTFLINLTNENIITSKNNEENIILPSEYWDSRVNTSTTIPLEDQEWFNEVEINTDGIIIKELEKLTDKQLTQNNLVNGKITVSDLMVDNQNKDGITKDSTLIPNLTTVTNKRLTSSNVTVSDIINDSSSLGLSRTSTLILDPPVNYGHANITTNGQYLPSDFNSSGVYDPTHSAGWDYIDQINVNVPQPSSNQPVVTKFTFTEDYYNYTSLLTIPLSSFIYATTSTSVNLTLYQSIIKISTYSSRYLFTFYAKSSSGGTGFISIDRNDYYYVYTSPNTTTAKAGFFTGYYANDPSNEKYLIGISDTANDGNYSRASIDRDLCLLSFSS